MSQLFAPYRAVGLVTDSTPYALVKRGKEHFINCSVGNAFQIYSCANLRLQFVSGLHPGLITGLIAYKDVTVTAVENKLYVWHRAKLVNVVDTKGDSIKLLYLFGELILVLDQSDVLRIYTTTPPQSFVTEVSLSFKSNPVTSILHPDTYLNKILVARQDGTIQLWNLKSSKIIYSFKGWNSPVICMAQSPAIDVIAFGLSNGSIVIHNVKADKTITTFRQRGAVISLAFRTDSEAWLASGDLRGQIAIWNLEKQCLLSLLPLAHGVGGDADVSALNVRENAKTTFDDEIDDEITRKSIPKGSGVTKLTFLAGEPVLVSSGADNALKMWLCEPTGARILRQRSGAAQPPGVVQFYQGFSDGGVGKDRELLCGGGQDRALRSLSLIQDAQSRELSQGKLAAKARRTGRHAVALKLPPITALDSCGARERYWDSVVTAHAGRSSARTWHYGDRRLGSHRLKITDQRAPSSRNGATVSRTITTVAMSNCGSFAFLGTAGGWIDKYNVQSGQHRGAALWSKSQSYAHRSSVTGLAADPLNRHLISASLDGTLKWWKFNTLAPMAELIIDAPATFTKLHCDGQLLAVACDDLIIRVYDAERRCLVRRFQPDLATDSDDLTESNDTSNDGEPAPILTKNKRQTTSPSVSARKSRKTNDKHAIDTSNNDSQLTTIAAPALPTSMCFSPDARWLVVAAMDAIRVYDVPSGTMIDWFRTQRAVTSIDFSPFGDFIATTHVGKRGVYLWANQNYFSTCFLKSLPKVPQLADLPNSLRVRDSNDDYRTGKNELGYDDDDNEDDDNNVQNGTNVNSGNLDMSKYAEQLSNGMITLSNVPRSHWQALSQLDTIKARNKPIEPPKAPKAAPFFLPTLSGVRPEFIIDTDTNDDDEKPSRIVDMASMGVRSPFVDALRRGASTDVECEQITAALASLSPSQVDMEIRQLRGKSNDDEQEALRAAIMGQENNFFCEHTRFLQYIAHELQNGRNFELIQAWLEVFLRIHSSDLLHNAAAQTVLRTVRERHNVIEERFSSLRTVSLCLVEHFAGLSTDF